MERRQIARVWVDDHAVYAETTDGLRASYEFAQWPRLRNANDDQRRDFHLSYGGIHWPAIDEDLSFEGMFHDAGLCDITPTEDSVYYLTPTTLTTARLCPPQRKSRRGMGSDNNN